MLCHKASQGTCITLYISIYPHTNMTGKGTIPGPALDLLGLGTRVTHPNTIFYCS